MSSVEDPGDSLKLIAVIHGPSLNLLGRREPEIYGTATLAGINELLEAEAEMLGLRLSIMQSNHEGALIDEIHRAAEHAAGILINPAACSHTSIAIRDALSAAGIPAVEVHLSNIHAREEFRRQSITAGACIGIIAGFGAQSYITGLRLLARRIRDEGLGTGD